MKPIKIIALSSTMAVALVSFLAAINVQSVAGFYQGSDGTPSAFTFEPISFLIGLCGGALAVGIPFAASKLARRNDRKIKGTEECDDKNDIPQARFGDKRPGVKIVRDQGNGNVAGSPGTGDAAVAGNPVPGIGIIVKKCPGSPGCPTETASVAGNPIGGLTIKGGSNKPPANASRGSGSGTSDPAPDGSSLDGTDVSKPVPGIGIIVKKCPDPNNPKCATGTK
jgi:hypothetical protein